MNHFETTMLPLLKLSETSTVKRRFPISKVKEYFQALNSDEIEQQLRILFTHVILYLITFTHNI